jgi:transposase
MKEIAQAFDIHYATVSRIVKKGSEGNLTMKTPNM